jgi:ABC transporter
LSEGERQRITIARAILRDAPILILDEPTSSVDHETEAKIMAGLDRLMANRTAFIIAHRLSTVRTADRVVVVREGRIVEQGTFAELLDSDGPFRQFFFAQWRGSGESKRSSSPRALGGFGDSTEGRGMKRIVVLGLMGQYPFGGMAWQVLHHVIGFRRLGYDTFYVENSGAPPYSPRLQSIATSADENIRFLQDSFRQFDLSEAWAYYDSLTREWVGMKRS